MAQIRCPVRRTGRVRCCTHSSSVVIVTQIYIDRSGGFYYAIPFKLSEGDAIGTSAMGR